MSDIFTVTEAAARLRADPSTLRRLLREGRLGGFRLGSDWRIPQADLEAFIAKSRNRPPPAPLDDDDDAYWVAEAEAVLDRMERGEETTMPFAEWERRYDALDS